MSHRRLVPRIALALLLTSTAHCLAGNDVGPLVRSLWLIHRFGTAESVALQNDQKVKGKLSKALGKVGDLTATGVHGLMDSSTFEKLAGGDGKLDAAQVRKALEADAPDSRKQLAPKVAAHADYLTTSFDLIGEPQREAGEKLADWIARGYEPGRPLHVTIICTGNSRRSILGATMGNIAAAYYGMPEVRFHSGGTAPTAFNPRAIACLKEIGVQIEPTGAEAPRGEPTTANPIYKVRWGRTGETALEMREFSKTYFDAANPQQGFAAVMVCGEADAACPFVKGAAQRVSTPFLDPKIYDGGTFEAAKYAERRDDVGRLLLSVMMQVRNRLAPR